MIKTFINGEFNIVLPKHRADRPEWYTQKGWEKARIQSLYQHLTTHDTLFYVGAEEGDIAALCARWVKEIVLFEPNHLVWPNIKAIWEANDIIAKTYCFSGFASNIDRISSHAGLYIDTFPPTADGPIIGDHGFKELSDAGEIPQVRIDYLTFEKNIIPSAITLDVEGSEWQVLRGAEKTINEYHPKIWLSLHPEFMFRIYGEYSHDLRDWLTKKYGYKEQLLAYDHEVHLYYST